MLLCGRLCACKDQCVQNFEADPVALDQVIEFRALLAGKSAQEKKASQMDLLRRLRMDEVTLKPFEP